MDIQVFLQLASLIFVVVGGPLIVGLIVFGGGEL